jgi:large subunit ribosomal protein L21
MEVNMFAVIQTGGKQYKVQEGSKIRVEKLEKEIGEKIDFVPIMIYGDTLEANPSNLSKYSVSAKVVGNGKGKKLVVFTYRNKTNEHHRQGHRQLYTELIIEKIAGR